jgi:signal peptidase II
MAVMSTSVVSNTHRTRFRIILSCIVVVTIIFADQFTKWIVRENLTPGQTVPVFGPLSWTYVSNTGAAFGMFQNQTVILAIFSAVSLVLMVFLFRYFLRAPLIAPLSLSMVFAGASSNLFERITLGEVTDFVDVLLWGDNHFAFFNIADSAISIGAVLLLIFIIFLVPKKRHG